MVKGLVSDLTTLYALCQLEGLHQALAVSPGGQGTYTSLLFPLKGQAKAFSHGCAMPGPTGAASEAQLVN